MCFFFLDIDLKLTPGAVYDIMIYFPFIILIQNLGVINNVVSFWCIV